VTGPRAFDDLTARGQAGRLRALAADALSEYEIAVVRVSYVARSFNTVFRVDGADGSTYALRVSPNLRIHADGCEAAEAAWVAALRRDTGLPVPQVIPTRDGSPTASVARPGVPGVRTGVLFEWVGGRALRDCLRVPLVRQVGALTAAVHEHGASYAPAPPVGALVADRVLYFRAPDRLDELGPRYGSVLREAVDRAQRALDTLWRNPPHRPHLLHGDVQPGNLMVRRDQVVLIDFQDLIWGFEIQDVLIALGALEHFHDVPGLVEAFRSGYESMRPWPEADAETIGALRAARHLNVLNFGLSVRKSGLDPFIARHADPLVEWMRAG
jgi:Ser/Thr protein kinase RdoA (MazF antagonist)